MEYMYFLMGWGQQSASESQSWQGNKTSVSNEFLSTTIIKWNFKYIVPFPSGWKMLDIL